ncbi:MAG: thiamine diphosphokinase [Dysgonomonas sp.]
MKYYNLITLQSKAETVILANGEFPRHAIPLALLKNCDFLVCCDGATNQLLQKSNKKPNAIVGDLDSLTNENRNAFSEIVHHIGEQETNDLTKSLQYCLSLGKKRIVILGATGKREDHTLGNISLLTEYIDIPDLEIEMITDYGVFNAIATDSAFYSYKGQQISIFNIHDAEITSDGLVYAIKDRVLSNWWQGTLNEANSTTFSLKTNGKILVFREF